LASVSRTDDLALRVLDLLFHLLEVGDGEHGLLADGAGLGRRGLHLAQGLAQLGGRHAGLALGVADLGLGLVELEDQVLQLRDDAIDGRLRQPQVRQILEHQLAVLAQLVLDLLLLGLGRGRAR
jgi:hypothetical protein